MPEPEKLVCDVGFHRLTAEEYHADPAPEPSLSRTLAWTMLTQSPLHGWLSHPRLGLKDSGDTTKAMDFGQLGHTLLLGKGNTLAVEDYDDYKTKEAREWRDLMREEGKFPVLKKDHIRSVAMREAVLKELQRLNLRDRFEKAESEVTAIWKEGDSYLRCQYDKLDRQSATVFDLKITGDASPGRRLWNHINDQGYDLQHYYYSRGYEVLIPEHAGRLDFIFLFAESEYPFLVTPVRLGGEFQMIGKIRFEKALAVWERCMKSGNWNGYADGVLRAVPPKWALTNESEGDTDEG